MADTVWQALAAERGGHAIAPRRFGRGSCVLLPHRSWTLCLDSEFNAATKGQEARVRAPFRCVGEPRFAIARRGILSGLAAALGMQDVIVGHAQFDRDFDITGTDEAQVQALLAPQELCDAIAALPKVRLEARRPEMGFTVESGGPIAELWFGLQGYGLQGVPNDLAPLRAVIDVVGMTLDRLVTIGAATDERPMPTSCRWCDHLLHRQERCPECGLPVTGAAATTAPRPNP